MVEVVFNGQVGNNLFQYFLGRCIAKEKNYKMTYKVVTNESNVVKFDDEFLYFNAIKLPKNIDGVEYKNNIKRFINHEFDWNLINGDGKILLEGFFQNYKFYEKYKNFIKDEIYKFNDFFNVEKKPNKEDIVLHLRLKNYPWKIDVSYYKKILKKEIYEKIWIITDDPTHQDILNICEEFSCNILCSSPNEDFIFLVNANKIVMSQSTFCWWASFLSKAEKIYYPIVQDNQNSGIWFEIPWLNIDLFVNNEDRYVKTLI